MDKRVRFTAVAAFLALCATGNAAFAVYEVEPNDSFGAPQQLVIDGSGGAEVTGAIGDSTGTAIVDDVDFYAFEGREGDVVTIDIDNGIKSGTGRSVDTILTLFRPDGTKERENDDTFDVDSGSSSNRDARLDNVRLPVTGTYIIAVYAWSTELGDGGVRAGSAETNGSYTLMVSGVSPASVVQQVNIDIKPGERHRARIDPKSKRSVPVALLSSPEFDALSVSQSSLTFGATGDEDSLRKCHKRGVDVNRDGYPDLVCYFEMQDAGFEPGDAEGILKGTTASGASFEGRGLLKVLREKRHHHHHGHHHGHRHGHHKHHKHHHHHHNHRHHR